MCKPVIQKDWPGMHRSPRCAVHVRLLLYFFVSALLASCATPPEEKAEKQAPELITVHYTTGLSGIWPKNSVSEVDGSASVFVWMQFRLPRGLHELTIRVFDARRVLVLQDLHRFYPTYEIWATWYSFMPTLLSENPGKWRCEIYIGNRKLFDGDLIVRL